MASFGHVAVGLLTGRFHSGGGAGSDGQKGGETAGRRRFSGGAMVAFMALALLPDADLLLVSLGACDTGACGHRGASHSLPVAVAIGLLGALVARRMGWRVLRTFLATTLAVASHALLDLLGAGGRGLPLLWPLSEARFMSPIRIFPDAPRGMALLSWPGITNVAIEFAVFLPLMVYAVWPRIALWLSTRTVARRIPKLPDLTFIEGGVETPTAVPAPAPAPVVSDEREPPLRSTG